MSRRRGPTTTDDAPASLPAVATSVNPLTESSTEVWRRWGEDRAQCEREARVEAERHNQQLTGPIYPRELAAAIADETRKMIPDWRLLREEHPAWVKKLIAQQPETRVREVQQFGALLRLFTDNLPPHIRPLVADLEAIIELRAIAREAAAFTVGCEVGRAQQQMHVGAKGRLVKRR